MKEQKEKRNRATISERVLLTAMCLLISFPFGYFSPEVLAANAPVPEPMAVPASEPAIAPVADEINFTQEGLPSDSTVYAEGIVALQVDSLPPTEVRADDYAYDEHGKKPFNPKPERAVWLSALFPGLGQIYNRRYWKLPIVIGGFMGLGYATNWNNDQYQDYMQGYRDLLDSDPSTNSYMNFFPPNTKEEDLPGGKEWLERTFKSKKDYFRRNRDLCIICLVALYALCMLDAYVDASLTHFDVSPTLSMDVAPTLMQTPGGTGKPAVGLHWAFTF